ncbi:RHS repeat domain-containing protein [uncultured Fibrella sp.]|uniref:RHS repeat domain-containing protein n=1 Tax=uncultured Fibrella sp. TaxID=1284596 RepID=UPI0035CB2CCF
MVHRYISVFTFILYYLFFLSVEIKAQSGEKNYVLSRQYKQANSNETNGSSYAGTAQQVTTQITYLDGLGKTSQQVQAFATPNLKDIVSLQTYDSQLRPQRAYLPAPFSDAGGGYRSGVEGKANDYYSNAANVESATDRPFVETSYEPSPLSRVSEQKAPGVGTGIRSYYKVNEPNIVRYYSSSGNSLTDINLDGGYYAAGTLTQTETQDENNKTVQKYTDRYGRVVMSRVSDQNLSTYYVYDPKGQLRAVIQPQFENNRNAANLTNYAFLYRYDGQGRLIEKYIPGGGSTSMTYDGDTDLLTASTDGRGNKFYYLYDGQKRQTEMGFCVGGDCNNRQAMVKTAYDSYPGWGGYDFSNTYGLTASDFVNDQTRGNRKGLVTAVETRVLLPDVDNQGRPQFGDWLKSVTYYDDKYRVIQVKRQLHGVGGPSLETVSYKLDFIGKVIGERTEQQTSQGTYLLEKSYEYDHMDRLTKIAHQVKENGSEKRATYTHVEQSYNQVGLLAQKRLHGGTAQTLNYRYTPRSWLGKVNNPAETYNVTLSYDANANINNLGWKTGGSNEGSFSLGYDGANRLTSATGSPLQETIGYDANGNITNLNRWRNGGQIDGLTYSYEGNRLKKVTDGTGNGDGFNNGNSADNNDYDYDANGNLTQDANRGISTGGIGYNLLNLTRRVAVNGKVVNYYFDGAGQKLKQEVVGNDALTTYYAGAFEYNADGQLQRVGLEEGQLRRLNTGSYEVEYYLRDHLGNVRSVVQENSTLVQQTAYYPFGLAVPAGGDITRNKYLYNGKEKQEETGWLDYGARMYAPEIGRWNSVDAFADYNHSQSTYNYVLDNPLRYIDLFGLWEQTATGYRTEDSEDISRYFNYLSFEKMGLNNTPSLSQIDNFINGEMKGIGLGTLSNGGKLLSQVKEVGYRYQYIKGIYWQADKESVLNAWHEVQGDLTPSALDPRTLNNNIFGHTYPGGDNPKTYGGNDDYSYMPSNIIEFPAIIHDLAYDKKLVKGASGLFMSEQVITDDWRFVSQEIMLSYDPRLSTYSRFKAGVLGYGLGAAAIPKTSFYLFKQSLKVVGSGSATIKP